MADPARPSNYLLDHWVYADPPAPVPAPRSGKFLIFTSGAPPPPPSPEEEEGGGNGGGGGGNGGGGRNDGLSPLDRAWRRITRCIADGRLPCSGAKCSTLLAALPLSVHGGGGWAAAAEATAATAAAAAGGGGGGGGVSGKRKRAPPRLPGSPPPPPRPPPAPQNRRSGVICVYCPDWADPHGVLKTGVALQQLVGYGERRLLVFKRDEETERGVYSTAGLATLGGSGGGGGAGGGAGFFGGGGGGGGAGPPGPAFFHYKRGVLSMAYGDRPVIAAHEGDPSYRGGFD